MHLAAFFGAAALLAELVLLRPLSPRLRLSLYLRLKRLIGLSRPLTRTLCFLLSRLPQRLQSELRSRTHPGDDAESRTAC